MSPYGICHMNEKSAFIKKPKEQASLFPPVRTQPEYIIYEASPDTKDTGGVTLGLRSLEG